MQSESGDSVEFLEHLKVDLFPDEVYVFTPRGQILALPRGATAVGRVPGPPQLRAYRVRRAQGVTDVLWAEEGTLQLPGETEATSVYALAIAGATRVQVRMTALDTTTSAPSTVDAPNGVVALTLSSRPVIVG